MTKHWHYSKGEWLADVYILQSFPGAPDKWMVIADDVPQGRFIDTPDKCSLDTAKAIARHDYQGRLLAQLM